MTSLAAQAGTPEDFHRPHLRIAEGWNRRAADEPEGGRAGALLRHPRRRQGIRQFLQARTADRVPAQPGDPVLDGRVSKMKEGGKAKLICPPEIAYGSRGAGSAVPPNATITFEVELLKVAQ